MRSSRKSKRKSPEQLKLESEIRSAKTMLDSYKRQMETHQEFADKHDGRSRDFWLGVLEKTREKFEEAQRKLDDLESELAELE